MSGGDLVIEGRRALPSETLASAHAQSPHTPSGKETHGDRLLPGEELSLRHFR